MGYAALMFFKLYKNVLALVAVASLATLPVSAQSVEGVNDQIDKLADFMEAYGFNGIVAAREEGRTLIRPMGIANASKDTRYRKRTRFDIGQITQHITSLLILKLVQEDKVSLNAPISTYIADLPEEIGAIPVRMLMNHTSGLPTNLQSPDSTLGYPGNLLNALQTAKLFAAPGSQFQISDAGYCALGLIAERVTGQTYASLVRKKLFLPVGTRARLYEPDRPSDIASVSGGNIEDPYSWTNLSHYRCGASGFIFSAEELMNWLGALADDFGPHRRLVSLLLASLGPAAQQAAPYANGIHTSDIGFGPAIWHNGDTSTSEVFAAQALFAPITIVLHTNSREGWRDLFKTLIGELGIGKPLNLPPRPKACKDCDQSFIEEGISLSFDGTMGTASLLQADIASDLGLVSGNKAALFRTGDNEAVVLDIGNKAWRKLQLRPFQPLGYWQSLTLQDIPADPPIDAPPAQ